MSEKETISSQVSPSKKQQYKQEAARRGISLSEFIRVALDNECSGGSLEDELQLLREELSEKKDERRSTEREISKLESRIDSLEKTLEGQQAVSGEYWSIVEDIAEFAVEYNPQTYTAHQEWERAVELSKQTDDEVRADVEEKIESLTGDSDEY